MKTCPTCHKEYTDEGKFCLDCGTKLVDRIHPTQSDSGIALGDKNVISGEVIGHKEDIRVSGNATIVKNEDQTKEVRKCSICGRTFLRLDGMECPKCGAS